MHIYYRVQEMIYSDPSEMRYLTELKEIAGQPLSVFEELEELTGADLLITPHNLPLAVMTLPFHLENGAILVQLKRGDDLVASVGDRAASSLARMISAGTKASWQRVLLFVGSLNFEAETGAALINGRPNTYVGPNTYWAVQGTIEKWIERGGVFSTIPRMSVLQSWISYKMNHIAEYQKYPEHTVYKEKPQLYEPTLEMVSGVPLQKVSLIRDWRNTLLTLPGIGEKRAEVIYQYVNQNCTEKTLFMALYILTNEELACKIPGISSSTSKKIREWIGLEDIYELSLSVKENV